jgi:hypothetical protein
MTQPRPLAAPDAARTAEARAELAESIAQAMPPLDDEQRARLRPILSGSLPASPADAGTSAA